MECLAIRFGERIELPRDLVGWLRQAGTGREKEAGLVERQRLVRQSGTGRKKLTEEPRSQIVLRPLQQVGGADGGRSRRQRKLHQVLKLRSHERGPAFEPIRAQAKNRRFVGGQQLAVSIHEIRRWLRIAEPEQPVRLIKRNVWRSVRGIDARESRQR